MENNVVTFQQLQMMLGVKESTVRALIKSNDFPESVLKKPEAQYISGLTLYSTGLNLWRLKYAVKQRYPRR